MGLKTWFGGIVHKRAERKVRTFIEDYEKEAETMKSKGFRQCHLCGMWIHEGNWPKHMKLHKKESE